MLYEPFGEWWCCLNPRERNMVKLLTVAFFANEEYIMETDYTILSLTAGLAGLTLVNQYFIDHYGLTEGFIFPEEEPPVAVLFFDAELWSAFLAFSFDDNYLCSDPCKAFQFWT